MQRHALMVANTIDVAFWCEGAVTTPQPTNATPCITFATKNNSSQPMVISPLSEGM
jgi:hypothetical protein